MKTIFIPLLFALPFSWLLAQPAPKRVETPINAAPSDAVVVFDGTGTEQLVNTRGAALGWPVEHNELIVKGEAGAFTRHHFSDAQIHVEFLCPDDGKEGGHAGNSGLYLHGLYELQIHNSHGHPLPPQQKSMIGSLYGQKLPDVDASRPAEQWQVYDILFHAPEYDADGSVAKPGSVTAFLNGVLVQENTAITKPTVFGPLEFRVTPYARALHQTIKETRRGPLFLQDHDSPVRFRNIWIRDLKPGVQP